MVYCYNNNYSAATYVNACIGYRCTYIHTIHGQACTYTVQYNKLANITSGLNQLGPKTVPRFELTILLQMSAFVLPRDTHTHALSSWSSLEVASYRQLSAKN